MLRAFIDKWLRREPPPKWVVGVGKDAITVTDPNGEEHRTCIGDIDRIVVLTDGSGPWGDDVIWYLIDADDRALSCFPLGADGEKSFIDYVAALPGYDDRELSKAMGSTSDARFLIWKR